MWTVQWHTGFTQRGEYTVYVTADRQVPQEDLQSMELVLQTKQSIVKIQTLTLEITAGNISVWEYLRINEWINERIKELINLLKPIGYVMKQQFNIQQLYVLPTLYLCVLYLSENKQRRVPLTA